MITSRLIPLVLGLLPFVPVYIQAPNGHNGQILSTPGHGVTTVRSFGSGGGGMQPGAPWPRFRNNNFGTSVGFAGGCNSNIRWAADLGSGAYFSSPAIAADGTVYVGTDAGVLVALSSTGATKWGFSANDAIWSSPVIGANGTIYFGSNDDNVYAVSPAGTQVWAYATGDQVVSSPALDANGNVYVGSWDNYIYALTPSGTLSWRYQTGGPVLSSPAIGSDGTIYVGSDDNYLYALSPTGALKWKFLTKGPIESSPSVAADGSIYIGSESSVGDFYNVSSNGLKLWEFDAGGAIVASPAIGADETIYLGSGSGFYALGPSGGLKWSKPGIVLRGSPAIGSDGMIYIGEWGTICQVTPAGTIWQWASSVPGLMSSPAIGPVGEVYFASEDGYMTVMGNQVNTIPLSSLTLSPAAATGGYGSTGTVTLTMEAPTSGDVVALSTSNVYAMLITPATVNWPQASATFSITTVPVGVDTPVTITAVSGGVTKTAVLMVKAAVPSNLSVSPSTVQGSSTSTVTGTVNLTGPAILGGLKVKLTSSDPTVASVPATMTIPSGGTSGTFSVTHTAVTSQTTVTLTATLNGTSVTTTLTVTP